MKGAALLLCAITLAQAAQPQLTLSGKVCHCDPGQATGVCSQYGSDNALIVHENCNQFYKCAHGQPVAYFCPGITLYNPFAETCDWPHNVDCGDRPIVDAPEPEDGGSEDNGGTENEGGNCDPAQAPALCAASGSDGVLVAHENCNWFYKCAHGVPVAMHCNTNLLYNSLTGQCDWAHNVDCAGKPIVEPPTSGDNNGEIDCEDENDKGECNCDPAEAPQICAQPGSDGVLVAHENCRKFYKCAHGVPVAFPCGSILLYNPYTKQCDWPQNVDCGDRYCYPLGAENEDNGGSGAGTGGGNNDVGESGSDNGGSGTDNGGSGTDNGGGTCNCNPGEAPGICAAEGSDGTLIAHENCNQFYKCSHGKPVALNCYGPLLYNPHTQQCDWPHLVDCGDRPIAELDPVDPVDPGTGDNGESGTDNGGTDTDNGGATCNCNPGEAPGICAADGSDGTLIAHENCNQFYKCSHGKPVALNCYGPLLYNPHTQQCDWPHLVDCGDRPIAELDPVDPVDPGTGDNGGSGTDNGGTDTDNGGASCNCNPGEAPGICAADGSDGTLIAHENCNQFYKCSHGKPVALSCYGSLLYNPHTQQCDWPHLVDCGDRPIAELDPVDPVDPGTGDNGGSGTDNGGTDTDNGGATCNCNPGEAPGICSADGSDGTLIAHENCNQFYKCSHSKPVALSCYGSLLYNPHTQQCDWPHLVDCGDRPIAELDPVDPVDPGTGDNGESGTDNGGTDTDNGGASCNCNPGEAPGICAADGSDGTLIAHENCNQFYKCSHGKPVALSCYGSLLYNPHTQQCDWPHLVDCGDRPIAELDPVDPVDPGTGDNGGSGTDNGGTDTDNGGGTCNCNPGEAPGICAADGSDGTLIAHENCNQFYKCSHGKPVALSCYGSLLYNPHTQQCDWPHLVDCGDRPIAELDPVDPVDPGNGDNGGSGTDNGGTDTDNGGGTCNCNPGEAPGICAADGSDGTLIAHENCNQFYKCSHGKPVALNCYGSLLYNPHTQQCDWPHLVDCGDRPIAELDPVDPVDPGTGDNGGSGTDNGGTDTDNGGGTCNCNPGEAPGICAADGSDGTLIAHENCNQFYKCSHGKPVALNCYGSLLYNPHTQQCDWPHLVDCGDRPIAELDAVDPVDPGTGDNGGNGTDNGGGTCNCNPGEAPGICAADGSDGTLIAHENCNQFYKCSHGKPVALSCYGSLLYNPHTQQCDWPHLVDCGDRPIAELDPVDPEDPGTGDNGGSGTDNGGTDTDNGGATCNCNPGEAPGICAADGSDGTLIAHENCNQFYKCSHGKPVALSCYGSLLYNPHTQQCDWPHLVDCGDRPIAELDPVDPVDPGNGDNGGSGTDNGGTDTDNGGGTCNCNPGEAPGICAADGSDGTLIAHENCNQFYKCSHGKPVALSCYGSLLYNPHTQQCDWPHLVDCGDRPIAELDPVDPVDPGTGGNGGSGTDNGGSGTDNEGGSTDNNNNNNTDEDCDENNNGGSTCNCNPDEAASICSVTGSDGIFVAHENCNQFYQCAHGLPVPKFCSGDLLYNPLIQRCDWPYLVECGDRPIVENEGENEDNGGDNGSGDNGGTDNGGTCNCNPEEAPALCSASGSDGTQVAHKHCNWFYKCAHGVPVPLHCSGDLLYNPYTERCDWPHVVECGTRPIVPVEQEPSVEEDSTELDVNCDPSQAPTICAASGSDGTFVAHENCNQYYICAHGSPVPTNCPSNLLYNPNINDCDWPYNVDCGDRIVPGSGGSDGPCACDARQAPSICAGAGSDGKLIAHEHCEQYWVCVSGVPLARSCPPSLLYEPHSEQCLWPAAVSCEGRSLSIASLNKHLQARRELF